MMCNWLSACETDFEIFGIVFQKSAGNSINKKYMLIPIFKLSHVLDIKLMLCQIDLFSPIMDSCYINFMIITIFNSSFSLYVIINKVYENIVLN
jgi:hypothetical protein